MLEGLEISIKGFQEISFNNPTYRLDSEFYKKEYLSLFKKIFSKHTDKLEPISEWITQGPNPIFSESKIPCLTGRNISNGRVNYANADYVSESEYNNLKRFQLKNGDTLITLKGKGSIGKIGYVTEDKRAIFSRDIGVIRPNRINSAYVNAYILSHFGSKIIERGETGGTGQSTLTASYLRNIDIVRLDIENEIGDVVIKSEQTLKQSKQIHSQAETLLLQEIGLQDFESHKEAVNVKSFKESFGASGRIDAEYYQPKYEMIEDVVRSYSNGFDTLDVFIENYSTGYPYKSSSYINEGGVPLIRINNIKKGFLDLNNAIEIPKSDLELSIKDIANENDLLISMSGTIGNSCKIPQGVKAVINQRIMRITPKNFNNEVLSMIINSLIGEYQLNRIGTGGVQTNISSVDIRKILIPRIKESQQNQIAKLIEQSFSLKKQSERLLEVAKKAVEIAIEENDKIALEFIKNNT